MFVSLNTRHDQIGPTINSIRFDVFSVNGTGFVAEEQTKTVDQQARSSVCHLPGNNGDRGLRRLQVIQGAIN